ncbi:PH domain-containing protein [Microbacterium sp. KUDC0406]|uniref:PH domain-containing protein n=1 Tax=Microbacterium sp. KUDC0406 TaxID=2909588 RepID=UPI001F3820A9|nr:PH domain-containing protein [Microbacterium sp. KUDC0406]UJP11552.1 PH domain-containing protein [Microbacterium sp. KUDC0406]
MTDSDSPVGVRTFRTPTGVVAFFVAAALVLFLLGDAVIRGSWPLMLLIAPWPLLGLWVIYEGSASSYVRVDERGVVVQNMLRRTSFGWKHLRAADFRWQLEFILDDDSKVTAMGGPAHARARRQTEREREVEGARVPAGVRALTEIQDRQAQADQTADAPIRRSWDWIAIAAFVVIAVWAVVAVLLTR